MSRKRAASPSHIEEFDDDFGDDSCSSGSKGQSHSLPVQRNAANARERARMRVLSSAFCRLKTKLPWVPADTKLSKLDTLRLATIYIQQLRSSLATGKDLYYSSNEISRFDTNPLTGQSQASMVWPFTFQQQQQQQQQQQHQNHLHHQQQIDIKSHEAASINRPQEHTGAWFERNTATGSQYNVNFYSTLTDVPHSSYDHEKYHQKSGLSNNNSLAAEHG